MREILLNIDISLAFSAVLINFVFALLVILRTSRAPLYIAFFFGCISIMVWNFGDFMTYLTGKRFWFYFSLIGSGMAPALMFHIAHLLVRPRKKWTPWVALAYLFSGLLSFSSPLALFHLEVQRFVEGPLWNILYFLLLVPFLLSGIVIVDHAIRLAPSKEEKGQLYYILIAFLIAVFTGLTDLVQVLKIPVPPLGHLGCMVYSSILAIGIFKHRTAYDLLAQIQTKLESLGEMAAGIAHEIRNPLTSIKGASDLLAKELKETDLPAIQEYRGIIAEEIDRLNHILTNFQYFTRDLKIEKEPLSLNEILQKTVKLAQMGALNLKIELDLSSDLPKIRADASLLKQVFLNLIKNAEEACGSQGELVIKTETISSWLKVVFIDNGPGISPKNLNSIFRPFFTTKSSGMGMGLAICQRIVHAHQGRIEVKNRLPKGAEFSIFLPV